MPELLHHQRTFIGCLSVQRVPRPAPDAADSPAFDELAGRLWHRLPAAIAEDDILLVTQGFDAALTERCPALGHDARCSVHGDRKPAICQVVPLDALRPDRVQHLVLAERQAQAEHWGSDCIAPGLQPGFAVVTRRLSVVDGGARAALAERRRDLADERRFWGNAVFRMLHAELFSSSERLARVPTGGFMTLSLAPVLMVLADVSSRCRARCIAYLDAQAELIQRTLLGAREQACTELDTIRQLNAFAGTNLRLRAMFASAPPAPARLPHSERDALEHWLGLELDNSKGD